MMIHIMGEHGSKLTNVHEVDVQPNAVDLRLGKVFKIKNETFALSEDYKVHRGSEELLPNEEGFWTLEPGTYEVVMENIIEIGEGEAGWVITRSTLNRNGVFLTSGLYDSGYHGVMAGAMHVTTGPLTIRKNTRIGQFLLFKAESLHKYNGSYGLNKEHDKKYGV
jgi:deoxycytidine triphosphate deaminase